MKIPIYQGSGNTVGQLQSARGALQSPQQAAAAAAAPFNALTSITDTGGEALEAFDKAKQATQITDDKLALTRQSLQTDTEIKQAVARGSRCGEVAKKTRHQPTATASETKDGGPGSGLGFDQQSRVSVQPLRARFQ